MCVVPAKSHMDTVLMVSNWIPMTFTTYQRTSIWKLDIESMRDLEPDITIITMRNGQSWRLRVEKEMNVSAKPAKIRPPPLHPHVEIGIETG